MATGKYDVVTITQNETSTGIQNPIEEIAKVVKKYPDVLLCVDMVSSAGGHKVDVDALEIDVVITSTQKCLALPPGMAFAAISDKAVARAEEVPNRGSYLDLLQMYKFVKKNQQYPSTPNLSLMFALDYQLDYMINEEGLENRFLRHKEMATTVQAWAKKYFDILSPEGYWSDTVTCIVNTRNIDVSHLNKELQKRNMTISDGYGDLKGKTFRIGHMGDTTMEDINELLAAINEICGL